jgi:tryptophan synthase beta chain
LGQVLIAKRLGKKRIIAETGAGQHGYATATVCARYGLECVVYMGKKDYERQRPNVYWMELLGATVIAVEGGEQTLNDAVIAAFKDLIAHPDDSFYLLGSAVGPHPYPAMNTYFQKVVGAEIKAQSLAMFNKLPDYCLACVGGGSNSMGMFYEFLDDASVRLIGVEAGGHGDKPGEHAAKMTKGKPGIFEGYASYFLQDDDANISNTSSVSAGLDYCGISPILAYLAKENRVEFTEATDDASLMALQLCAQKEGVILALESAHAMAEAIRMAPSLPKDKLIVVNASGRGEKDLFITMDKFQPESLQTFIKTLQK